jgi:hypothetical protein
MAIPKQRLIALIIVVISIVGMILLLATDFAGFYLTGYYSGYRYSCLSCEYNTGVDTAAIIIGVVLLVLQLLLAANAVLPTTFLKKLPGMKIIPILGLLIIVMMMMGGISFGISYDDFVWWFEVGFYGGLIAGILNTILAVLGFRIKE